jgi:hypothetical protein
MSSNAKPSDRTRRPPRRWWPLVIAALSLALVLSTGDGGFLGLRLGEAPGVTLDEGFNVAMGVYLVRSLREEGLGIVHPATVREVYGSANYNPDHPPLGRWALGIVHEALSRDDDVPFREVDARPASALAFALTVLLVGVFVQRWSGSFAGAVSALVVAFLPRQFGHAHLASLETFIGLAYTACVLVTADRCLPKAGLSGWRGFALAGVLFGLALLTKIQAVFLAPAVALWALSQWSWKAIPRVALFGAVGLAVFFVGWPWLWLDPLAHLKEYLARTTDRQTLYCYYLGERWADRDVPWHYPWVMFAVTLPLGSHVLAALGAWWRSADDSQGADAPRSPWIDPRIQLVLSAVAIPLVVFSVPGIRVYDGERLFCVVFPLWGALAGFGAQRLASRFGQRTASGLAALVVVASMIGGAVLHPFQLSYSSAAVGFFPGADRLGFERSYWMEGLTESFQREIVASVPRGSRIDVAPVLHPVYLPHLERQSPILREAGITLHPYDDKQAGGSQYVLHFWRKADPWQSLDPPPLGTKVLAEVRRLGVPLVTLLELRPTSPEGVLNRGE